MFNFKKVPLNEPSIGDLRNKANAQKNQRAAAIKRRRLREERKKPNSGMRREETPVDDSHTNRMRRVARGEKEVKKEGRPAFSYSSENSTRRSQK